MTEATECYGRALSIYRELGNRYLEADTLIHLGDTRNAAGDPEGARAAWQQAVGILDYLHHAGSAKVSAKLEQLGETAMGLPARQA